MNTINFIKTLSPKQQYALARWYTVSSILIACTIIGIVIVQTQQLYTLYCIQQQHATLLQQIMPSTQLLKHHEQLQEQENILAQKKTTINNLTRNQRLIPSYSTSILAAVGAENVVSLVFNDAAFTVIVHCNDTSTALHYLKQLQSDQHFTQIKLITLQPSSVCGKQFTATIIGTIKTP